MTPRGFQIGRVLGTDIYMSPTFLLLIAFYFFMGGRERASTVAIFSIAVILSLLIHEFGHAIAVRRLLKTEPVILLWGLGGLCMFRDERGRHTPGRDLVISLAGPAFSAILGAIFIPLMLVDAGAKPQLAGDPYTVFVWAMAWINGVWLLVNLAPILPLDGGQALRAILAMNMQRHQADVWAARVSVLFAGIGLALGLHFGWLFLSLIAAFTIIQNLPRARGQL